MAHVRGDSLLLGVRAGDKDALAGVDYDALAESYHGVPADSVAPALQQLRTNPYGKLPVEVELHYAAKGKALPVLVHCWNDPSRVREEIEECREGRSPPEGAVAVLDACTEIVAIELAASQFGTMGVVFAYEVARYLAQKGAGVFVDDEDDWYAVVDGAFEDP